VLEREARAVMAELVTVTGRPMVHDLRAVLDAINYVTRYGIEWRAMPVDFPPYEAVYAFLPALVRARPARMAGQAATRSSAGPGRAG
jgi:transposase